MRDGVLILALAAGTSGTAISQEPDHCIDPAYFFEEAAYPEDGIIDRDEFAQIAEVWFAEWDIDDSGYVDEAEFAICYEMIGWDGQAGFAAMDRDGDGELDETEFFNPETYEDWDTDGDGVIDAQREWF